jgi:DNA-binding transcriptional MerR regulator
VAQRAHSQAIYSIGAVARMLLVPVATLRSWEDRYAVVVPDRSAGGQRLYTRRQVEQLQYVRARVREGFSASEAHRMLEEQGDTATDRRPAPDGSRPLVLLAESDPYGAEMVRQTLSEVGYDVEIALDAGEAEAKFKSLLPDVTVVEWLISGGVGGELIRRLKARSSTPVLVISTLALGELVRASGAEAFLPKPLNASSLVATVRELLGESSLAVPAPFA